jgi:hypothetical protein
MTRIQRDLTNGAKLRFAFKFHTRHLHVPAGNFITHRKDIKKV